MTSVIIIGGGISGLSFAYYCQQHNIDYIVLEASARLGGCIESYLPTEPNVVATELGAHALYNTYTHTISLLEELGLAVQTVENKTIKIIVNGEKRKLFTVLKITALLFNICCYYLHRRVKDSTTSVQTFFTKLCGSQNYCNLIRPALWAVFNQNPDNIPRDYLTKKISAKKNKAFPRSFSLTGGIEALVHTLAKKIAYQLNTPVIDIQKVNDGFQVITATGNYAAKQIVLAVPAEVANRFHALISFADASPIDINFQTQLIACPPHSRGAELNIYAKGDITAALKFSVTAANEVRHYRAGITPSSSIDEKVIRKKSQVLPNLSRTYNYTTAENVYVIGSYIAGLSIENCLKTAQTEFMRFLSKR